MESDNIYEPIDMELAERRFKAIRAKLVGDEGTLTEEKQEEKEDERDQKHINKR